MKVPGFILTAALVASIGLSNIGCGDDDDAGASWCERYIEAKADCSDPVPESFEENCEDWYADGDMDCMEEHCDPNLSCDDLSECSMAC